MLTGGQCQSVEEMVTIKRWKQGGLGINAPLAFEGESSFGYDNKNVRKETACSAALMYVVVDGEYVRPRLCLWSESYEGKPSEPCLECRPMHWDYLVTSRNRSRTAMNLHQLYALLSTDPEEAKRKIARELANEIADRIALECRGSRVEVRGFKDAPIVPGEPQTHLVLDVGLTLMKGNRNIGNYNYEIPFEEAYGFFENLRELAFDTA